MTTQITVSLPDAVANRAYAIARSTQREVGEVVAETITAVLEAKSLVHEIDLPKLPDDEVLRIADAQMPAGQSQRLAELNSFQKERPLTPFEAAELSGLVQFYAAGNLIRSQALAEAVRRNLRARLS